MIQETSRQAYNGLKRRRVLGRRQRQILDAIVNFGQMTNQEIAARVDLPINSVTGRVLELREKGFVEQKGVQDNFAHRPCIVWGTKSNQQQLTMEFIR